MSAGITGVATRIVLIGQDASGNDVFIRVTDDGFLVAKFMAFDVLSTEEDIQVVCDPDGKLFGAYEGDLTITMGDVEKGVTETFWLDKRREWTGVNLIYEGWHTVNKAATSDANWRIKKYTWDGNGLNTREQGPVVGAWDDRATASWWA